MNSTVHVTFRQTRRALKPMAAKDQSVVITIFSMVADIAVPGLQSGSR
jgi:hypothetical protein